MSQKTESFRLRISRYESEMLEKLGSMFGCSRSEILRAAITGPHDFLYAISNAKAGMDTERDEAGARYGGVLWSLVADGLRHRMIESGVDPFQVSILKPDGVFELWRHFIDAVDFEAGSLDEGAGRARFGMNGGRKQIVLPGEEIKPGWPLPEGKGTRWERRHHNGGEA
ncbi:MAG: hypothetical protein LAT64_07940 [Phycisphaerales bacterium]|nr:hypothetical protein [Planctomycetota bacterium]MCH8508685.1 hypothetical protein [Phycisphaerales bacterium]